MVLILLLSTSAGKAPSVINGSGIYGHFDSLLPVVLTVTLGLGVK